MTFGDLQAGDVMELAGTRAVVLAIQSPHPLNPSFLLVVWYIFNDKRISFDMLHPDYELISGTTMSQDGMYSYRHALTIIGWGQFK